MQPVEPAQPPPASHAVVLIISPEGGLTIQWPPEMQETFVLHVLRAAEQTVDATIRAKDSGLILPQVAPI